MHACTGVFLCDIMLSVVVLFLYIGVQRIPFNDGVFCDRALQTISVHTAIPRAWNPQACVCKCECECAHERTDLQTPGSDHNEGLQLKAV